MEQKPIEIGGTLVGTKESILKWINSTKLTYAKDEVSVEVSYLNPVKGINETEVICYLSNEEDCLVQQAPDYYKIDNTYYKYLQFEQLECYTIITGKAYLEYIEWVYQIIKILHERIKDEM